MPAVATAPNTLVQNKKHDRSRLKAALSGGLSNCSTLIFQPLENVKIRLQVNDGMSNHHLPAYRGFVDATKSMWKNEGIIAFYRGSLINIFANSVSNFLFFGFYADGKERYNYDRENSSFWLTTFISMRASMMTVWFVNPLWWVKTRVILSWNEKEHTKRGYKLVQDTVSSMARNEGISSFYRGMMASLFLSLYSVVQMTCYEQLSKFFGITEKSASGSILADNKTFFVGGTSRWIASLTFYPVNVIKHRLQKQRFSSNDAEKYKKSHRIDMSRTTEKEVFYTTYRGAIKSIIKNEGLRGFYKGWVPNLIRIFLDSGVFFTIYETINRTFDRIK